MQTIFDKDNKCITLVAIVKTSEATQNSVKASRSWFLTDSQGQT